MATPPPRDLFTNLTPTIDAARSVIASLGLRTYRCFLIVERFAEQRGVGGEPERTLVEIVPAPAIRFLSASRVAMSGGAFESGAVEATKITRTLSDAQLLGQTESGDERDRKERFSWGLVPRGQQLVHLYKPASVPVLEPLGWKLMLNPVNRSFQATLLDR
jgi:hypothetical protein